MFQHKETKILQHEKIITRHVTATLTDDDKKRPRNSNHNSCNLKGGHILKGKELKVGVLFKCGDNYCSRESI